MTKETKGINSETTKAIRKKLVDFLLKERLENYGYDLVDWQRLQRQRNKAKSLLKIADINKLKWEELSCRFQISSPSSDPTGDKTHIRYIVYQSRNEEITNVMRCLLGLKGWAS